MNLFDIPPRVERSAEVSDCGRYRWWLRRSWSIFDSQGQHVQGKGVCCFVMLNPSTADDKQDDPTIRRCIGFARSWGYNALSVRNLFPWRATDPRELRKGDAVTGGLCGDNELLSACTADLVVAAWGAGVPYGRDLQALAMFEQYFPGVSIYCLGKTKAGKPRHPLYVKAETQPQWFAGASPTKGTPCT